MMISARPLTAVLGSMMPVLALGYDVGTHARMTHTAMQTSVLAASMPDLGLNGGIRKSLGKFYFDVAGSPATPAIVRRSSKFEESHGFMPGVPQDERIPSLVEGWLMRGSIREDDVGYPISRFLRIPNPQDNPGGGFNRVCNHFYDPVNNVKLAGLGIWILCVGDNKTSAPVWGLGVQGLSNPDGGIANTSILPDHDRRNHYTVLDAREAMWRALTLKQFRSQDGVLQTGVGGTLKDLPTPVDQTPFLYSGYLTLWPTFSSDPAAAKEQYRNAYWATTFHALGSVVHLIQDMAQPQHTRIEKHPYGAGKEFERYIEARALLDSPNQPAFRSADLPELGIEKVTLQPLNYITANPRSPMFRKFADYWTTVPGGDVATGLGLADYSNRGFFSYAHNIGQGFYPLPPNNPNDASYLAQSTIDSRGSGLYLKRAVFDALDGRYSDPIRLTLQTAIVHAAIDSGVAQIPITGPTWVIDHAILDDYVSLLIPRAVDYSAGFFNNFFRGKMVISPSDDGVYGIVDHSRFGPPSANNPDAVPTDALLGFNGFGKIKLKLRNATPPLLPPGSSQAVDQTMPGGTLVAVLKFHRNRCYTDDLQGMPGMPGVDPVVCRSESEEIVVSKPKDPVEIRSDDQSFEFEFEGELPINATDVYLQVVYRGQLGDEADAVVVATRDLSEPTFFSFHNALDYIRIGPRVYSRAELNSVENAAELSKVVPQSCVDYTGARPQLRNTCFQVAALDLTLGVGTRPATIQMSGLPVQRFFRFAYLADTESTTFNQIQYNCLPAVPFVVRNMKWQVDVMDDGSSQGTYPVMELLRGHSQWSAPACVYFGDGHIPTGAEDDDRRTHMGPVGESSPAPLLTIDF